MFAIGYTALAADAGGRIGVSMNLWKFSYDSILPCLEIVPLDPVRQEKELPAAVKIMVAGKPRCVFAIPRSKHVPDLTSPGDILRVTEELNQ